MAPNSFNSPTVLYIVGHPRCGSTIVGNILDLDPGYFHAGELHYLWHPGLPLPRQRCGCGTFVRDCSLWQRVFSVAFGETSSKPTIAPHSAPAHGLPGIDAAAMFSLQREALRRGAASGAAIRYRAKMATLYRAILAVTGKKVVIDSSKWTFDARLLAPGDQVELHFVHLVRDPWGAVFSRMPRDRPGQAGSTQRPPKLRVALESLRWLRSNIEAEWVVGHRGHGPGLLRYEDFARNPNRTLKSLAESIGVRLAGPPVGPNGTIKLGTNHTAGGNRNRWQCGEVAVHLDLKWKDGLHRSDQFIISTITLPYRAHIGY